MTKHVDWCYDTVDKKKLVFGLPQSSDWCRLLYNPKLWNSTRESLEQRFSVAAGWY